MTYCLSGDTSNCHHGIAYIVRVVVNVIPGAKTKHKGRLTFWRNYFYLLMEMEICKHCVNDQTELCPAGEFKEVAVSGLFYRDNLLPLPPLE